MTTTEIDEDATCSDCFESLDDEDFHCPNCGGHVDGLGTCIECGDNA